MYILKPIVHETIWGGEKLAPLVLSDSKSVGHLYSLITGDEMSSIVINGEHKGTYFKDIFEANKDRYNLSHYNEFPLIIALVEANKTLSIQVHPNDDVALELENLDMGKNESWYFLKPPTDGYIYNGCNRDTIKEVKQAIDNGEIIDTVNKLDISKGDYVYVESGTLHAATEGALFYEIEENCNLTYRFYDFDRIDHNGEKRALHINKALKALIPSARSETKRYDGNSIIERLYTTRLHKNKNSYSNNSDTIECLTIISGSSIVDKISVTVGYTIVIEPKNTVSFVEYLSFIVARPHTNNSGGYNEQR